MHELALFAGIGGGILGGTLLGWRTVCAVEKEPYCREVLLRRQRDGVLPLFPIWDDVKTFDGKPWRGKIDVISAGFPCQPFSLAGKRQGDSDERNLWPDTIRIIREVRPQYCLLENVPGLMSHPYFGTILGDLAASGYDCRWDCIPASACGAPHQRDRLWIVAYASGERRQQIARGAHGDEKKNEGRPKIQTDQFDGNGQRDRTATMADAYSERFTGECELYGAKKSDGKTASFGDYVDRCYSNVADAAELGRGARRPGDSEKGEERREFDRSREPGGISNSNGEPEIGPTESWGQCRDWPVEPDVGRVVNGLPLRVDRLKALGNGQVSRVAAAAWRLLRC